MDIETRKIFTQIASIQLDAIKSIQKDHDVDLDLVRTFLQVSDNEWESQIEHHLDIYQQMKEIPTIIRCLTEYQLLVCAHILFKMEEDWMLDNSQGVYGAWSEIHKAMLKFHPEFTLSRV